MVIYEVNIDVDRDAAEEFRAWLAEHVAEMLALPGFTGAKIFAREEDASTEQSCWTVHYELDSRASLERYFENHAQRMRDEGLRRFKSRLTASRRVLIPDH